MGHYGRLGPMVLMYNPQDADYRHEMSVRLEIARVFDACFTCGKCVDACGVFPRLFDLVDHSPRHDAELLTSLQQDEVLQQCHFCMQCIVQCPYAPSRNARGGVDVLNSHSESNSSSNNSSISEDTVDFPALVIRHRAMLWSNQFLSFREKIASLALAYSPWWQRLVQRRVKVDKTNSSDDEATVLPTCVAQKNARHVVDDFVNVCAAMRTQVSVESAFVCCGANDLFAGNSARFRRLTRRNRKILSTLIRSGKTIVVAQPTCLAVLKNYCVDDGDDDSTNGQVSSASIMGPVDYLARRMTAAAPDISRHHSAETLSESAAEHIAHVVVVRSSMKQFATTGDVEPVRQILNSLGISNSEVVAASFGETAWTNRQACDVATMRDSSALARSLDAHVKALDPDHRGGLIVVGESELANRIMDKRHGWRLEHPVSFLAKIFR